MTHRKGRRTASGVYLADDFRDHLIIDRHAAIFDALRREKLAHMRSENSEDVLTWNVFRSLRQIDANEWFPRLFAATFGDYELPAWDGRVTIGLWDTIEPPPSLPWREGATEVDILLEGPDFVWFIEAKYKSDMSVGVTHNPSRHQIQRNVDVGSLYAGPKAFYFSMLVLDELHSPLALATMRRYLEAPERLRAELPHRADQLENVCRMGVLTWAEVLRVLATIAVDAPNKSDRGFAERAMSWLATKLLSTEAAHTS